MKEKTFADIKASAAQFFEPGEELRAAARGVEGPAWALFLGAIGMALLTKQRLVLVTDRNVYLMRADRWIGKTSKGIVAKHPRGSVAVKHESSMPFDRLLVGDQKMLVGKLFKKEAAAVAVAAS